jgi:hypothetical protein
MAILIAVIFDLSGCSVRTRDLHHYDHPAISVGFYYFSGKLSDFQRWNGFAGLKPPVIAGMNMRDPIPFTISVWRGCAAYAATVYLEGPLSGCLCRAYATMSGECAPWVSM